MTAASTNSNGQRFFSALTRRGRLPILNGDFFSHLRYTADLLIKWGNTEYVCLAGLCHAVYGIQGFQQGI